MRCSRTAGMTAAVLSAVVLCGGPAVGDFPVTQCHGGAQMGPSRNPDAVIEEPRPPSAAVETEGPGERRNCRDATITERQDSLQVTRTERRCDR